MNCTGAENETESPKKAGTYEKHVKELEEGLSDRHALTRTEYGYVINGDMDSFHDKKNVICMVPYCLKDLDCESRAQTICDYSGACEKCDFYELLTFVEGYGFPCYQVVSDSKDIPAAIEDFKEKRGRFDAVVAVSCLQGITENRRFIDEHPDVPILFLRICGGEDCDFYKAQEGKYWGKTEIDLKKFKEAWEQCFGSSPSTLQQES